MDGHAARPGHLRGPGLRRLKPDFTYRVWFHDDDPLIEEFDAFEKRFGNDEAAVVVVHSPSGIFDLESSLLVYELTERLWRVPDVIRVDSLANFNWVHSIDGDMEVEPLLPEDDLEQYLYDPNEEGSKRGTEADIDKDELATIVAALAARREVALKHETLPGYLVSKDGNTAVLLASLKPAIGGAPNYEPVVMGIRELIANFDRKGDHEFHVVGGPAISISFKEAAQADVQNLVPIVFGLAFVFLALFFRRVSGVVLPFVIVVGTVVTAMGMGGWLGFSINNMTSIVPQILLAIAVADSVHILSTYFRSLARGAERKEAARYALQKNFVPTLLTSVSTATGFFSFATADVLPIAMLGVLSGLGTLLAWLLSYLWLGPLMVVLPINAKAQVDGGIDETSARGMRQATWLQKYRRPIMGVSLAVAAMSIALGSRTEVNSDPFSYFPADSDLNKARIFLEENIGGPITMEASVYAAEEGGIKDPAFMRRAEAFQVWLDSQPYVTSTVSLIDILKSTNRSLHDEAPDKYVLPDTREGIAQQYLLYTMSLPQGMDINDRVTVREDALRISSSWTLRDSKIFIQEVQRVRDVAKKDFGLEVSLTGKTQLWQRMNPKVVDSFATSITIALVLMTLLMITVFRSVSLGLLAMVPNGLPLLVGAAFLVVIGKSLDIGTVIVFSVCLGIAVDDTVHFLANYNALRRKGLSAHDAIANIFTHTMPALVITTVVLVAAFGTFAFASFVPNQFFGILVAFILGVALLTDATLLPALLLAKDGGKDAKKDGKLAKK
ncbi:MAG: putative RND superfamily exporter protein [Myxococcota bacterium]